ncbi:MAG: branched-chain amino acid ABC transporter permease, partial [Chloroflexales bacterium]|nr:branched-chain amino acid ABC transporter permease [Chloroflexales bacterium]
MAGLIAGIIVGLVLRARLSDGTLAQAATAGALAGAVAGVLVVLGAVLRATLLDRLTGQPASSLSTGLIAGSLGLVLAVGLAAWLSASGTLPGQAASISLWATLGLIIAIYPFLDSAIGLGWIGTVIISLTYILLALGLNIVVGYAGLLDLGYAAFFAIGAYTNALLNSGHLANQIPGYQFRLSFWLVIWVAAAAAAIFGLILGAPTLPLRGDYLAIVTL